MDEENKDILVCRCLEEPFNSEARLTRCPMEEAEETWTTKTTASLINALQSTFLIKSNEELQTTKVEDEVKLPDINNNNNNPSIKPAEDRDVIKKICPLMKHNSHNRKFQSSPLIATMTTYHKKQIESAIRSQMKLRQINIVGQLNHSASRGFLLIVNLLLLLLFTSNLTECSVWPFNVIKSPSPIISSAAGSSSVLQATKHLWPVSILSAAGSRGAEQLKERKARQSDQKSSSARDSPAGNGRQSTAAAASGPVPPPITQQYHYFWNHDQLEPRVVANEASKILAEAQAQTDRLAIEGLSGTTSGLTGGAQARASDSTSGATPKDQASSKAQAGAADPMQASGSGPVPMGVSPGEQFAIPQAVQQQLTAMVLQMQRQQQASMMMQPRFGPPQPQLPVGGAQRRLSAAPQLGASGSSLMAASASFMNPFGRLWMTGSAPMPIIAPAPSALQLAQLSPMMTAAESMQQAAATQFMGPQQPASPFQQFNLMQNRASPAATMAGVPIFGPFLVNPHASGGFGAGQFSPVALQMQLQSAAAASQQQQTSQSSPGAKGSSGRSSRRKSWPLFNFGSSLMGDRSGGSLLASASQPHISVSPPPQLTGSGRLQRQQLATSASLGLPYDQSAALMDLSLASTQLAQAIAGQLQGRLAQQKLASAVARALEQATGGMGITLQSAGSGGYPAADGLHQVPSSHQSYYSEPTQQRANARVSSSSSHSPMSFAAPKKLLQAPYSLTTGQSSTGTLSQSSAAASTGPINSNGFESVAEPFNGHQQQLNQHYDLISPIAMESMISNATSALYGDRLKRRHLSNLLQAHHLLQNSKGAQLAANSPRNQMDQFFSEEQNRSNSSGYLQPAANEARAAGLGTGAQSSDESNLRHLFMILATESPPTASKSVSVLDYMNSVYPAAKSSMDQNPERADSSVDQDPEGGTKQTQLRRLKRSSGWKSMDSIGDSQPVKIAHQSKVATFQELASAKPLIASTWNPSPSMTSWSSIEPENSLSSMSIPAQTLIKRHSTDAQVTQPQSARGTGSKPLASGATNATLLLLANGANRQDRSLKVKRISLASASFMHHPFSTRQAGDKKSSSSTSLISGPLSKVTQSTSTTTESPSPATDSAVDPMVASLSESSRVANYFQNVDNEKSSQPAEKQVSSSQQSLSSSMRALSPGSISQHQQPTALPVQQQPVGSTISHQIPVGYSAPTTKQQQQQQQQPHTNLFAGMEELRRKQQVGASRQQSGNGMAVQSSDYSGGGSQLVTNYQRKQQPPQSRLIATQAPISILAGASSADISSSATRNVPYSVNNILAAPGSSGAAELGGSGSVGGLPGQLPMATAQTGSSALARAGSMQRQPSTSDQSQGQGGHLSNLQGKILNAFLSLRNQEQQNNNNSNNFNQLQRNSVLTGSPVYTSMNPNSRQSSSFGGQQQDMTSNSPAGGSSSFERSSTSGDQSTSYGDEMVPQPPPPSPQASGQNFFGGSDSDGNPDSSTASNVGSNQSSMSYMSSTGEQQQQVPNGNGNGNNDNQQQQNNGLDGSTSSGNMIGFSDSSFGSRSPNSQGSNGGSGSATGLGEPLNLEQAIDLSRYSQQQQQQQQQTQQQQQQPPQYPQQQQQQSSHLFGQLQSSFNQTVPDNYVSDGPELYGSSSASPFGQSQSFAQSSSFNQQPQPQSDDTFQQQQLIAAAGIQTATSQPQQSPQAQQFYSPQQLQALGAAVSNFNQQRFSQQLQDAALRGQLSQQQTRNSLFAAGQPSSLSQFHPQVHHSASSLPGHLWPGGVDEEAAAGTAAAAGIPTYPTPAQLMAMQAQSNMGGPSVADQLNGLMMAGSEQRSEQNDDEGNPKKGNKNKQQGQNKNKKQVKQVSHHYHFNSLYSPFEDPESHFGPLNPLDIAGTLSAQDANFAHQHKLQQQQQQQQKANSNKDEKQEEEAEKPKKKGFLRRFSLKNLFKKLKKDKKKGNNENSNEESNANSNSNAESSNDR